MPAPTESTATDRPVAASLRGVEPEDRSECARVMYQAFAGVHDHHRFTRDFPTLDAAAQLTSAFIAHPSIWGVVAERDGRIIGSNFLDERGPIRGLGPITVDPAADGHGVGRLLMNAALERSSGALGVRLLQDSFNVASLSLYASLGFEAKEQAVVVSGRASSGPMIGVQVRTLDEPDLPACEDLCIRVHGFERTNELRDAIQAPALKPFAVFRDGRLTAYATTLTFFPAAYAVGETEDDLRALILGTLALGEEPASFLLPTRQAELFRWCLAEGLRVVKPMTYMAVGAYREPEGNWIPSVLY
jgi:GNAT superfamily N-acetyltransferase